MLTYDLEKRGAVPLYEYLYRCIRGDILSGRIAAGDRLPSKRSCAENLGISVITVENAYAQLAGEGYILSMPRRGYVVQAMPAGQAAPVREPLPADEAGEERPNTPLIDFGSNRAPDFPFSVWSQLMRELLREEQSALMTASPSAGILPLRRAIAAHLRDYRGMTVSPEQIIVGAGTEYLYGLIAQLLGSEMICALEDPGYPRIAQVYAAHNVRCVYRAIDGDGMDPEALTRDGVTAVHVSPSHHFPTGQVMPIAQRLALLRWAAGAPGRYIIEDDYDSELRLQGKPIPTMQSIDTADRVIYLNTFTKTLSSTVRISYMVLPRPLLARFRERLSFYACTVPNLEQYTLTRFIERGHFDKHLNRMRNAYRIRRDELVACLQTGPLVGRCSVRQADAGLHFLLRIRTELSDEELCRRCLSHGLRLDPLARYRRQRDPADDHVFVMNYSSLRPGQAQTAAAALADILTGAV